MDHSDKQHGRLHMCSPVAKAKRQCITRQPEMHALPAVGRRVMPSQGVHVWSRQKNWNFKQVSV